MEASGHGLAIDEFVSYQRASTVLLMSLKEMVSIGKLKTEPEKAKFINESLTFCHSII